VKGSEKKLLILANESKMSSFPYFHALSLPLGRSGASVSFTTFLGANGTTAGIGG